MNDPKHLKILVLTSSYPRAPDDSASVFLRYMVEALEERGLDIHVIVPSDGSARVETHGKITVHRFQYFFKRYQRLAYGSGMLANIKRCPWLWLEVPCFTYAMLYAAARIIRREQIDVIHAHWILPQGIIGLIVSRLFKVPLITTAHGADAFGLRNFFVQALKRFIIGRSDIWTANTRATAAAISPENLAPKPQVIPMGVDVDLFRSGNGAKVRADLAEAKFLLLFVGRLVEKKGCHDLLRAFSLLPPGLQRQCVLWIIGDGDQRGVLENTANEMAFGKHVQFWGAISNHKLPDFYAGADLFIAPAIEAASGDTEGQGVVLLEAFAARLCVLATRVGGIGEVISDGENGRLVKPGHPQELATTIELLLSDPEQRARLADNAYRELEDRYSWKRIAKSFEIIYRQLAGDAKRRLASQRAAN